MTAAPSIPPVLNPGLAEQEEFPPRFRATLFRAKLLSRYRAHIMACAPEIVEHAAEVRFDETLRACMLVLRELRECRRDTASMIEAEAVALTDWEAIAEGRRR